MNITKKQILSLVSIINSDTKYIDCGGCGVFAYLLGSCLEQFDNCKVRVKVRNYDGGNLNQAVPDNGIHIIYNWNENGVHFNHIILKIKLKGKRPFYLDSNGIYKRDNWIMQGSIPVDYIQGIVSQKTGWNDWFDRDKIPNIVQALETFFHNCPKVNIPSITDWELRTSLTYEDKLCLAA